MCPSDAREVGGFLALIEIFFLLFEQILLLFEELVVSHQVLSRCVGWDRAGSEHCFSRPVPSILGDLNLYARVWIILVGARSASPAVDDRKLYGHRACAAVAALIVDVVGAEVADAGVRSRHHLGLASGTDG